MPGSSSGGGSDARHRNGSGIQHQQSAPSKSEKLQRNERLRSATEGELAPLNLSSIVGGETEIDAPYRSRLYQLFGLIEKEFDALYAENCALHSRIAALTEKFGETGVSLPPSDVLHSVGNETSGGGGKGSARKAMQMGQKLRTALRGPPGRLVFKVGGTDGRNFRMHRRFVGHKDGVWHVCANEQMGIVASASADQTARVCALDTGVCLATYTGHSGSVNCVSLCNSSASSDSLLLCTASGDESAHIWRTPINSDSKAPLAGSSDEDVDGSEKEEHLHENENVDSTDPSLLSDGLRIRVPSLRLTGHTAPVMACEWMAGGQQVITASWDRTANIYDAERGDVINILSGHEQELNHCCAHAAQKLVVTSSKDSTFRLWDFRDAIHSVAVFQGHNDSVTSVAFSSGDRLVSGSDDRTVKVWDLRNMRCALSTIRLSSSVNRLAVSQTHSLIAIPHDNRHVRIYDINGVRVPRIPNRRCHHRMVCATAWADDHPTNNLITCGFDRQVIGWKVTIGKEKETKD